jgi:acetate kinase
MNILALNAGSNSLKFEIVAAKPAQAGHEENPAFGKSVLSGVYDNISKEKGAFALWQEKRVSHRESKHLRDHGHRFGPATQNRPG